MKKNRSPQITLRTPSIHPFLPPQGTGESFSFERPQPANRDSPRGESHTNTQEDTCHWPQYSLRSGTLVPLPLPTRADLEIRLINRT